MSNDPLDLLAAAQPVDVPARLEARILRRVAARRRRSQWAVRIAAAAAVVLWATQGYIFLGADLEAGGSAVAEMNVEDDTYAEPLAYLLDLPDDNTLYSE